MRSTNSSKGRPSSPSPGTGASGSVRVRWTMPSVPMSSTTSRSESDRAPGPGSAGSCSGKREPLPSAEARRGRRRRERHGRRMVVGQQEGDRQAAVGVPGLHGGVTSGQRPDVAVPCLPSGSGEGRLGGAEPVDHTSELVRRQVVEAALGREPHHVDADDEVSFLGEQQEVCELVPVVGHEAVGDRHLLGTEHGPEPVEVLEDVVEAGADADRVEGGRARAVDGDHHLGRSRSRIRSTRGVKMVPFVVIVTRARRGSSASISITRSGSEPRNGSPPRKRASSR